MPKTQPITIPGRREADKPQIPDDVDEFERQAFGDDTTPTPTTEETGTPEETPQAADDEFSFGFKDGEENKHSATPDDKTPATDTATGTRDYSQYDPDVAAVLKKLPNALYAKYADQLQAWKQDANKLKDVQTELSELRKNKPAFLTDHPQAYRLSDDFIAARQQMLLAKQTAEFWQQQLENIEQGLAWQDFRGYDNTGNPVFADMPALENGQIDVRARLRAQTGYSTAIMQQNAEEQRAMDIKRTHAETVKTTTDEFHVNMTKLFKGMTPEKLSGKSADLFKNMVASVPVVWRNHPLVKYLALAGVSNYQNALAYKSELAKYKPAVAKPVSANPRNRMQPGTPAASTVFNIEDL